MGLGEDLRRMRRNRGMTQAELAESAGMSVEGVSLLERGRRLPRISTMVLLADALCLKEEERAAWLRHPEASGAAPSPPPTWVGELVGREQDVAAVTQLFDDGHRMVTITGLGGMGKSRCAAAVARRMSSRRPDGVSWIPMAALRDRQAWWEGVAAAFGVPAGTTVESLAPHLSGRELLIVCDGAELLLERCRHLVIALASRAASVQFLTTSRRRLQVPGERVYALAPLALAEHPRTEAELRAAPASELFLRIAERPSSLPLTASDIAAVQRICRDVDGLPLAIELVASRADIMGLPELATTVAASLTHAATGSEKAAELAGTLAEKVVGWSRQSLAPEERDLLARLSVFAAAFGQADAQSLLGGIPIAPALSALVASSLLVRAPDLNGTAMFRMLTVVRAVAAGELTRAGLAGEVQRAHAEHLARFIAATEPLLTGDGSDDALAALDVRAEDIDAAMAWAAAHDPALALTIAGSVWRWCYLRGRYAQGRAWAAEALDAARELTESPDLRPGRARCLGVVGGLAFLECDYDAAEPAVAAARVLYHELGNSFAESWALGRLGAIARERGEYADSRRWHEASLALLQDAHPEPRRALARAEQLNALTLAAWLSGDAPGAAEVAERAHHAVAPLAEGEATVWAVLNRGIIARLAGRLGEADALLTRAHAISERHAFPEGMAWTLNQRGVVARLRGDGRRARLLQEAALAEHRRLGDRWRQASTAEELALLAAQAGDHDEAAGMLAEATRLREEIGAPVPLAEADVIAEVIARLGG